LIEFPQQTISVDEEEINRKLENRKKTADRLREAMHKKKEEKDKVVRKELEDLENLEK
jgi:hypothetical protein